ncbi:hypothetical protein N7466_007114 [Penicillium verhagenii]|uniref:uncharacterized protein n=1 Tax=Penicillium verhagenii TaxID=1562060 RepID=UPI002544F098|nr:uncharacterized protein N7466_007114 [Penicillium verhagenii]KAJ5928158.1 hypothetical protein N7466_007114 [Penicillium verhagenii]
MKIKHVTYGDKFWKNRKAWTPQYKPDYSSAPPGFDPTRPGTGSPDTSAWPVFDGHTRGNSGSWPPPAGVVLGSSLVYDAIKRMPAKMRGHCYPINFASNGTIRPTCPPFGPMPIINSNCLIFVVVYQQYYCFVPESVVRSVGYLLAGLLVVHTVSLSLLQRTFLSPCRT